MQNAPFTNTIKEELFDLPKHHPKLGKVKEYEKSNSKNGRNTKRQNLKPVKNDRSGLLVLNIDVYPGGQEKEQRGGVHLAKSMVVKLCKRINGKDDNITCDNFFTSLPVAEKFARQTIYCRNNAKKSTRVVKKND